MLMHAIAHGGCIDTVRESAQKVGSGRKVLCPPGIKTASALHLAFQSDALPTELFNSRLQVQSSARTPFYNKETHSSIDV